MLKFLKKLNGNSGFGVVEMLLGIVMLIVIAMAFRAAIPYIRGLLFMIP